jgi:hypothetical protein
MAGRKAIIPKDDLNRMATVCASKNVVIEGEYRGFRFTMSPAKAETMLARNDDLDDRLDEFAAL